MKPTLKLLAAIAVSALAVHAAITANVTATLDYPYPGSGVTNFIIFRGSDTNNWVSQGNIPYDGIQQSNITGVIKDVPPGKYWWTAAAQSSAGVMSDMATPIYTEIFAKPPVVVNFHIVVTYTQSTNLTLEAK